MTRNKLEYLSPETNTLEIKTEGVMSGSLDLEFGDQGMPGPDPGLMDPEFIFGEF